MDADTRSMTLRMPVELWERLEQMRGRVARETYVRDALEMRLDNRGPIPAHQPGPDVENIRSSSQAKRDVAPIPKAGK